MTDGTGIGHEIWQAFTSSPLGQAVFWGGSGGLVAWWSIAEEDRQHAMKKQVALGGIVAAGTGSLGAVLIKTLLGAEFGALAAAGIGPVAFFMGVFGPAYITMKLKAFSGKERTTQEERSDDEG